MDLELSPARRVGLALGAAVVMVGWLLASSVLWVGGKVFRFTLAQADE